MSLKTEHRPTAVRGALLLLILGSTLLVAMWSRAVYQPRRNTAHLLVISASVVLLGSAVHAVLCALPWLCTLAAARFRVRPSAPRSANQTASSAQGYSVHSVLLSVFDVARARRLSFSRQQVWLLGHPFALGLFALAVALPCYDLGCSVSLCAGLSFRGTLEEFRRGALWKRKTREQMLVGCGLLCGYALNALLFAMAYVALSHLGTNDPYKASTVVEDLWTGNASVAAYYNGTFVFLDRAEFEQYLASGADARMPVRVVLWSLCFCAPALLALGAGPDADLAQNIELARPGVAATAGVVLLGALAQQPLPLVEILHTVNALGSFYLWCSGFLLAALAFAVLRLLALRRSLYACMVLHGACIARVFAYDGLSLASGTVQHLVVVICILGTAYVGLAVLIVRGENHAIRLGWGGQFHDDRFVIGTSDDEDDGMVDGVDLEDLEVSAERRDVETAAVATKYNVDDVINTVEDAMRQTEERMILLQSARRIDAIVEDEKEAGEDVQGDEKGEEAHACEKDMLKDSTEG